jgi:hypothetical protein
VTTLTTAKPDKTRAPRLRQTTPHLPVPLNLKFILRPMAATAAGGQDFEIAAATCLSR